MTNPTPTRRGGWLLPEDGIVDDIAIELAAHGIRPVALTPTERTIAATRILTAGGTPHLIARRLRMSHASARALADQITATCGEEAA